MSKTIRDIYGETLAALGADHPSLVVLDADVSGSTKSGTFAQAYPDRFFNIGIAESNMVATAAGMAAAGKTPFVNTFAVFLGTVGLLATRAQVCYGGLNVKFAGAYCGLSDSFDGATHHACEDISAMRSLPDMKVFVPSDAVSTRALTALAADTSGPVYLRLSRDSYPDLYPAGTAFQPGGAHVVRQGSDVTVLACGILVHEALDAARMLESSGVSVRVVDLYSIKPIDRELILRCAAETGALVCAEEHSVIGGLGSAVAEVLAQAGVGAPTAFVGVNDVFTESGPYRPLLNKYGLDAAAVKQAVLTVLDQKKERR